MYKTPIKILVVDDDLLTCTRHKHYFEAQGYQVQIAHNGLEMWQAISNNQPALILLDIGLPGKDGLELARELRAHDEYLGIILVTARDDDIDKIVGLESGANDYVTKPFNARELLARVKIVLRETYMRKPDHSQTTRLFGKWTLDIHRRHLIDNNNQQMVLSRGEMSLLVMLAQRPGTTVSRQALMQQISDRPWDASDRTIDVLVSRLRRKLETNPQHPELIITMRGEGYALIGVQ